MFCPNYKNKEIFDGFNEIIEALGGKPMTEDEFKSSDLRFQRTGLDYSAMEAAYHVYHLNNGNLLNLAPNGKDSILFNTLLKYFEGDRKKAIKAKVNVYSNKFFNWFGNWTRQYGIVDDSVKYNIINSEGEINWEYFESLMDRYHNKQPDSMFAHGRYTLSTRPENHFSEEKNTLNHIKFVTQSMLNLLEGKYDMDLPFVSEARASLKNQKDLMILAAMFHDVAKPYRHGDIHGWESADILRDVLGLNYDNRLAEWAVRHHMPMPFSHKADFNKSNPEALEVAKNIARDAKRVGIDANTAINAWILINAADVINGRDLSVEDNWAKKAAANGPTRYGDDISVKNVLSTELKEKVELLKWAFEQIKDEDFGDTVYNYSNQERFDYQAFPEGGREDKKLPYLNNVSNVSKIVDENGEPFIVYHNTRAKFDEFDKKYIRTADGFFFTVSNAPMKAFGDRQLAVYLNVRNLKETDSTFPTGDDFDYQNDGFDGMQYFFMDSESFIIPNPNQIKHVENLGAWNPENDNMRDDNKNRFSKPLKLDNASGNSIFGTSYSILSTGGNVSSNQVLTHLISTDLLSEENIQLAKIIARHNIPIMFGEIENGKIAATITDSNGGSIIVVNSNEISNVTNEFLANRILHEVIHALTSNAISNPKTKIEKDFSRTSNRLYSLLDKVAPKNERNDIHSGGYVMQNQQEFAAVFATDENARNYVYRLARKYNHVVQKVKQFVDSIVNLFIRNYSFAAEDATALVGEYKAALYDYLYNRPTAQYGDIKSSKLIDILFETASGKSFAGDSIQNAIKNAEYEDSDLQVNYAEVQNKYDFETVASALMTRLQLIKRSNIGKDEISRQSQLIESQASMLTMGDYAIQYQALQSLASQIGPQLHEDYDRIKNFPNLSGDEYMDYMHTNVGTYKKLATMCSSILKDPQQIGKIMQGMYKGKDRSTEDGEAEFNKFKAQFIRDVQRMIDTFDKIENLSNSCIKILDKLRTKSTKIFLLDIGRTVGDPDIENYVRKLERIDFDISSTVKNVGSADAAKDTALRALAYLVNNADTKTYKELNVVAKRLANALEGLSKKELKMFYELDLDNNTTGFLVRKRNYGVFYNKYNDEIVRINRHISSKYNINLDDNNRLAPDQKDARKEWNHMRNDWLEKNCDRRYVNRYYRAQEELSTEALLRMQTINSQIYQINMIPGVIDEKTGKPDYSKLDDEKWQELQNLITKKKFLRKEVDEWGNQKCDAEIEIAREINKYYETLYPKGSSQIQQDVKAWKDARHSVFVECGGDVNVNPKNYDTFIEQNSENFDSNRWKLWNERNSKLTFITDANNKPLIFKQIEAEFGQTKPYYGEEEAAIAKQINDLISTFYGTNMIINDIAITKSMQNKIKNLIKKQLKLRKAAMKNNPILEQLSKKYGAIFNSYIEFVTTERFNKLNAEAMDKASATGAFDELFYYEILSQYGNIIEDWTTAEIIGFRPFRWFTVMRAKNLNRWMEWTPGDAYNDIENSKSLKNEFFDESDGTSFVPLVRDHVTNKLINPEYDNSKIFEKITKPGTKLANMYNIILSTMKEANSKMENRTHVDNYLLPQIGGTLYTRLTSNNNEEGKTGYFARKWKLITDWIGEKLGIKERKQQDDYEQLFGENMSLDDTDETGTEIKSARRNIRDIGLMKNMPDDRSMHMIPQFFTNRKNPKYISKDLLGIIFMYYQMASNYKNKLEIKNQCEMIIDTLSNRNYEKRSDESTQIETIPGTQTNTYQFAEKFLEMNLYDIRRTKHSIRVNKNTIWQYTNALEMLKNYTTANNLGTNPKVSIVGVLTSQYNHLINSICGNGYSFSDSTFGGIEVIHRLIHTCLTKDSYIGNMNSKDKLMVIDEAYNVQNQLDRKLKNSNLSRAGKVADENSIFGFMSGLDFISKSAIAVSILHSFRFVDGEWISKDMIYRDSAKIQKDKRQQWIDDKINKYKKAKKYDNLYTSISVGKNGEFLIEDERKRAAYTDDIHHIVKSRIEKLAERADGMATKTQKAAITQSEIGALTLVHRQYLPLMIQERFGEEVYDYDMAMYKNGQTRLLFNLCADVAKSSMMGSSAIGAGAAYILLRSASNMFAGSSIPVLLLGAIGGYLYSKNKGQDLSMKDIYKKYFDDDSTEGSTVRSFYHKRILKQIAAELLIYNILIAPIIGFIASKADDDKHKTWWLQFAALCLRQFQWESYTPYRFDDVFNNFKSVSAATGTIDYLQSSIGGGLTLLTQTLYSLLNTLQNTETEDKQKNKVKSGVYKGWDKSYKNFYKLNPIHNMYQQGFYAPTIKDGMFSPSIDAGGAIGPYKMRQYMESSIMKLED